MTAPRTIVQRRSDTAKKSWRIRQQMKLAREKAAQDVEAKQNPRVTSRRVA